jgi:hypothetical protein
VIWTAFLWSNRRLFFGVVSLFGRDAIDPITEALAS